MLYYVYIIQSLKDGSFYKGFSQNPIARLQQHNNAEADYTRHKIPWTLVYAEQFESKKNALIREKALKKYSHSQILQLIDSHKNQLTTLNR